MPDSARRSRRRRGAAFCAALAAAALAGCATLGAPAPALSPLQIHRALLGRNPGVVSLRAVVEARASFAGTEVSLPGVLRIDQGEGFRLELLDPLDRPRAIFFSERDGIVQYRPEQRSAALLGVLPAGCAVDPAAWVGAITASSLAPPAGAALVDRGFWRRERVLEREQGGELRQSVRYRIEGERLVPRAVEWYCGGESVLRLQLREWVTGADWRMPMLVEIEYPKAALAVRLELREIEVNPPAAAAGLRPKIGSDVRWAAWVLPR